MKNLLVILLFSICLFPLTANAQIISGGMASTVPGIAPQIQGYTAAGAPENETVSNDCTFTRTGANAYSIVCTTAGGGTGSFQAGNIGIGTAVTTNRLIIAGTGSQTVDELSVPRIIVTGASNNSNKGIAGLQFGYDTTPEGYLIIRDASNSLQPLLFQASAFTFLTGTAAIPSVVLNSASGGSEGAGTINATGYYNAGSNKGFPFASTTVSATAPTAIGCTDTTVSVTSATTAMSVIVTPQTNPNGTSGAVSWSGYVSTAGTVDVRVCNFIVETTPPATTYNIVVLY